MALSFIYLSRFNLYAILNLSYLVVLITLAVHYKQLYSTVSQMARNHQPASIDDKLTSSTLSSAVTVSTNSSKKSVRILCWLMVDPSDLDKRVIHVKDTWSKRCDIFLYFSSRVNKTFPTIGLNVSSGRSHIALKSKLSWTYICDHYLDKADFFVKADPDTYIVVENLRAYMSLRDPNKVEVYGHRFTYPKNNMVYVSGATEVLTRKSLELLVRVAYRYNSSCIPDGQLEDYKNAACLHIVNATFVDTRDMEGKETFFPLHIENYISNKLPKWYISYRKRFGIGTGRDCCSRYPISFHYVSSMMLFLDYLFYVAEPPYKPFDIKPNNKENSTMLATQPLAFYGSRI